MVYKKKTYLGSSMKTLTDQLLLEYTLESGSIDLKEGFELSPQDLSEKLLKYINVFKQDVGLSEDDDALTMAATIAKTNKDPILMWLVLMCINGIISIEALLHTAEASVGLLTTDAPFDLTLGDMDPDSVFNSFATQVLPELIEVVTSKPTLFCFMDKFDIPIKLKAMLQACVVMGEINTFPDYDRYLVEIEVPEALLEDVIYGLKTVLYLAHLTALTHIAAGDTNLGAALSLWTRGKIKYPSVYKSICGTLGTAKLSDIIN